MLLMFHLENFLRAVAVDHKVMTWGKRWYGELKGLVLDALFVDIGLGLRCHVSF